MRRVLLFTLLLALISAPWVYAKVKVPKAQKCEAMSLTWPGAGQDFVSITGCKLGASLSVMQAGKLKYAMQIESDEGGAYFEKMGKLRFNKKKKRIELTLTVVEEAPEYSGTAKAVLYFDGRQWKVACDQKFCEVLP